MIKIPYKQRNKVQKIIHFLIKLKNKTQTLSLHKRWEYAGHYKHHEAKLSCQIVGQEYKNLFTNKVKGQEQLKLGMME
jgi:type IV secretory pathway component VirB8